MALFDGIRQPRGVHSDAELRRNKTNADGYLPGRWLCMHGSKKYHYLAIAMSEWEEFDLSYDVYPSESFQMTIIDT
jgi:hypothetical protein